jgi:hypothetical protein
MELVYAHKSLVGKHLGELGVNGRTTIKLILDYSSKLSVLEGNS